MSGRAKLGSLALLGTLGWAGAAPAAQGTDVFAVVVGHNGGIPGLAPLRYADDDAIRFALLLRGLDPAAHVWLLTDVDADTTRELGRAAIAVPPSRSPTRRALAAAFEELARALSAPRHGRGRVLYVVYAGHGLRGRVLLAPEAGQEAAVTGAELRASLAGLSQLHPDLRMFLFVDACRSQSLFADRDAEAGPDFSAEVTALERRGRRLELGVLTAAAAGKPAGEVADLRAGYFSHVLASGLAGAADASGDEVVSFGELAAFVAFNTQRLTGQLPWFDPPAGGLDAAAIDHRGHRPRLFIPRGVGGRFVVKAPAGTPVFAEAFKDPQRSLLFSLPVGRYRIERGERGGRILAAAVELVAGQLLDAGRLIWAEAPGDTRGEGPASGGDGSPAFAAPFSPEVVSTLEAGFRAGREPLPPLAARRTTVAAASVLGTAPLGLGGMEMGLALHARRTLGALGLVGLRAGFATSSHRAGGQSYRLEHHTVAVEGGARWGPARWLALHALGGLGAGGVVQRGAGAARGDPLGPLATVGIGLELALGGGFALPLEARSWWQWVRVDGARQRHAGLALDVGLAYAF
jgi:Caspase domain